MNASPPRAVSGFADIPPQERRRPLGPRHPWVSILVTFLLVATSMATVLPMAGFTVGFGEAVADRPDFNLDLNVDQAEGKTLKKVPINYTLEITNLGLKADTYTFAIGGPGIGQVGVVAKVTVPGSQLDRLSLEPGESGKALLTITIDSEQGSYEVAVAARSLGDLTVWDSVSTLTHVIPDGGQEYGLKMAVDPAEQLTEPWLPVYYRIKLINTGNVADVFLLTLGGPAHGNPKVKASLHTLDDLEVAEAGGGNGSSSTQGDQVYLFLNSGQTGMVILRVLVLERAGDFEISVTGISKGDPQVSEKVVTLTKVKEGPQYKIDLWAPNPDHTTAPHQATDYWMVLKNQGESADLVRLTLSGDLGPNVDAQLYLLREIDPVTGQTTDSQADRFADARGNLSSSKGNKLDGLEMSEAQAMVHVPDSKWVYLRPDEKVQLVLRVLVTKEANAVYSITVNAQSRGGASDTQETLTTVKVTPTYGLNLWAWGSEHRTGQNVPTAYLILARNTGNVDDRFKFQLAGQHYGAEGVEASLQVIWPANPEDTPDNSDETTSTNITEDHRPLVGPDGRYYTSTTTEAVSLPLSKEGVIISLHPGQVAFLLLTVTISYPSGNYEIAVAGQSLTDRTVTDKIVTKTTIFTPQYGVDLNIAEPEHTVEQGQITRYLVTLTNTGNVRDTYSLWLGGPDLRDPRVTARLWLLYVAQTDGTSSQPAYQNTLIESKGRFMDLEAVEDASANQPQELPGWSDLRVTLNPGQTVSLVLAVKVDAPAGSFGVNVYARSQHGFVIQPALETNLENATVKGSNEATGRGGTSSDMSSGNGLNLQPGQGHNVDPTSGDESSGSDSTQVVEDLNLLRTYDWAWTVTTIAATPVHGVDVTIQDDHHYILSGGHTNYHLQVTNTGNVPDVIDLQLSGSDVGLPGVNASIYLFRLFETSAIDSNGRAVSNGDDTTLVDSDGTYLSEPGATLIGPLELDKVKVRLDSQETVRFLLRVAIDLGPGDYEVGVTGTSSQDTSKWDSEMTVTTVRELPTYGVALKAEDTKQTIEQGGTARYLMTVVNTGEVRDKIVLELGGPAWGEPGVKAWISIPRVNSAGQYEVILRDINNKPLTASYDQFVPIPTNGKVVVELNAGQHLRFMMTTTMEVEPGEYQLNVKAASLGDPTQSDIILTYTSVILVPRYGVDLKAPNTEMTVEAGQVARYIIGITNTGNVRDTFKLALGGSAFGLEGVEARLSLIRVREAVNGDLVDDDRSLVWANDTYILAEEDTFETPLEANEEEGFYLFLRPGRSARLMLSVTVENLPGKYEVSVTATSLGDSSQQDAVVTVTRILEDPFYKVDLFLKDPHHFTTLLRPTYYLIGVTNEGNIHDTIKLEMGGTHFGATGVKADLFFPAFNQVLEKLELENSAGELEVLEPTRVKELDEHRTDLSRYVGPIPSGEGHGLRLAPGQTAFVVLRVVIAPGAQPAPDGFEIDVRGVSKGDPERDDFVSTWTHIYLQRIADKIEAGTVAGAFYLHKGSGEAELYDDGLSLEPVLVEPRNLKLKVAGEFNEGRVVVVHLDKDQSGSTLANPQVKLDGVALKTKPLSEVLDKPSEGGYAIVEEQNATQLVVAIPHFSEHELEVTSGNMAAPEPASIWDDRTAQALVFLPWLVLIGVIGAIVMVGHKPKKRSPAPMALDLREESTGGVEAPTSPTEDQSQWSGMFDINPGSEWRPPKQ